MDERTLVATAAMTLTLGLNRLLAKDLPRFRSLATWVRALVSGGLGVAYSGAEMVLKGTSPKQAAYTALFVSLPSLLLNAVEGWAGGPGDPSAAVVAKLARRASMRGTGAFGAALGALLLTSTGCSYLSASAVKSALDEFAEYVSDVSDALSLIAAVKSAVDSATKGQLIPAAASSKLDDLVAGASLALDGVERAEQATHSVQSGDYTAAVAGFGAAWDELTVGLKAAGVSVPTKGSPPGSLRAFVATSGASTDLVPLLLAHRK